MVPTTAPSPVESTATPAVMMMMVMMEATSASAPKVMVMVSLLLAVLTFILVIRQLFIVLRVQLFVHLLSMLAHFERRPVMTRVVERMASVVVVTATSEASAVRRLVGRIQKSLVFILRLVKLSRLKVRWGRPWSESTATASTTTTDTPASPVRLLGNSSELRLVLTHRLATFTVFEDF